MQLAANKGIAIASQQLLVSLLFILTVSSCFSLGIAAVTNVDLASTDYLFNRCPLFDRVVHEEMLSGKITPEQAFAELDSHNCPIIRGASITSPQQLKTAAEDSRRMEIANQKTSSLPPPGQSMADECRRLSDIMYSIDQQDKSPEAAQSATQAMDELCNTKVPLINNCPLFRNVKARYMNQQITAQTAVGEMKENCPILSKELNPAMLFNFEEYGTYRDLVYDVGHASHSHSQTPKCCCGRSNDVKSDRLVKRRNGIEDDVCVDESVCMAKDSDQPLLSKRSGKDSMKQEGVSGLERILGGVFPKGNPAVASLLATLYISLFPNLILFATPTSIPNKALRIMVSFAVGGLLGDVFLHLLPHMFGHDHDHGHHEHAHEHQHDHDGPDEHVRNTVYGCSIFIGLILFFVVDKFMRLLGIGHDHNHGHRHGHGHSHDHSHSSRKSSEDYRDIGSDSDSDARYSHHQLQQQQRERIRRRTKRPANRKIDEAHEADEEKDVFDFATSTPHSNSHNRQRRHRLESAEEAKKPIRLSAYLNLVADAAHNFTDGLAMAASFYLSHAAGLSTFVAVFFHEIPHELGDFAILVQSGFSRTSALASQFFTALGAFAGTLAGILIEESSKGNSFNIRGLLSPGSVPIFAPVDHHHASNGSFGSWFGILNLLPGSVAGVPWSKLVIPFTAGGFIYVGTVTVMPDLLQPDEEDEENEEGADSRNSKLTMAFIELGAMFVGLAIMAIIALNEE